VNTRDGELVLHDRAEQLDLCRQSRNSLERKDGKVNTCESSRLNANRIKREAASQKKIYQNKGSVNGMRTTAKAIMSRGSLIGAALTLTACLATPLWAAPFFFATGNPNGLLGALSRRASPGNVETETADDFVLQETTVITQATIFGLIPSGTPLENIRDVEVEVYHVFPLDSDVGRTSGPPMFSTAQVPTRNNSPSDVEIDTATRARSAGTLTTSARVLGASFTVGSTVVNSINVNTGSEGSAVGEEVEITITFTSPIVLPPGHYFFRPEVLLTSGDFLYLSGPRPLVPPPFSPDLQAWIRNSNLAPDWLRIGTDIIGGAPTPPTFNMAFSLTGETVPKAGTTGQPNCHGQSISALAHQFGGIEAAASALGFSSVQALQSAFALFCE
jgi:hypothetical protein